MDRKDVGMLSNMAIVLARGPQADIRKTKKETYFALTLKGRVNLYNAIR